MSVTVEAVLRGKLIGKETQWVFNSAAQQLECRITLSDGNLLALAFSFGKDGILSRVLTQTEPAKEWSLEKWVEYFSPDLAQLIPSQISIQPEWAFLFLGKTQQAEKTGATGLSLKTHFQLSELPFELPFPLPDFGINAFRLFWTWGNGQSKHLLDRIPDTDPQRTVMEEWLGGQSQWPRGFSISMETTGLLKGLPTFQLDAEEGEANPSESSGQKKITFRDNSLWVTLDKKIGPVTLGKAGIRWRMKEMSADLMLDITTRLGPVQVGLMGFGVKLTLKDGLQTEMMLEGVGLSIDLGPVSLAGVLLRTVEDQAEGGQRVEYNGFISVKLWRVRISGFAAYTNLQGQASFMVYAGMQFSPGFPLGALPITFTGIALGFGVNRELIMPGIGQLADFPLVKLAMGQSPDKTKPEDPFSIVRYLSDYFRPKLGYRFLAIGLQFEVAKLMDCFALAILKDGDGLEFHLLGALKLVFPEGNQKPTMLRIELAFLASLNMAEGTFKLDAGLSRQSFLFSDKCRLTGELSLYTWFKGPKAGDFVLSLGGYHPSFSVPAHYPKPQKRLGFEVNFGEILIKGGVYFALSPKAIMAGGNLNLLFHTKTVSAGLDLAFDVLVAWEPFAYDVSLSLNVWVKLLIKANVSVDMHLFGPPLSGMLRTRVLGIWLEIKFGAQQPMAASPIDWVRFRDFYLEKDLLNLLPAEGILGEIENDAGDKRWVLDPQKAQWEMGTLLPVTNLNNGEKQHPGFGIAPMEKKKAAVESLLTLELWRGEEKVTTLDFEPIAVNAPAALWGEEFKPTFTSPDLVHGLVTGYRVIPRPGAQGPLREVAFEEPEKVEARPITPALATVKRPEREYTHPQQILDAYHEAYG